MVATMTVTRVGQDKGAALGTVLGQGAALGQGAGAAGPVGGTETVCVRIDARDPISEAGVRMQLRSRPEIRMAHDEQVAQVVIAVTDTVDEDATRWLRGLHRHDGLPVVLVSGRVDGRALSALVEAGVRGVLRRPEATADRLVAAVRAAAAGHGDLPPELLRQLLDHLAGLNRQVLGPHGYSFTGLTERERTVLQLLADGLSTREVALRLSYSERTIKTVIQDLTLRLQLRNRTQAVAYALRNGWI
ncbi:response regulator transcription factor [Actinocrinis puniceicyclus]|uniref:Response regulator transcription factor n=1 Tax=Actinocrinis puniceicyclus TaxID=977794 RepID=A0A8J7WQD8_9ACTN|nr:response regulator transcription factor [Actinocrinis puniceicyclus]MBS2964022.1 response regulator transcription factor [Actinocrinis puniceicyclus]